MKLLCYLLQESHIWLNFNRIFVIIFHQSTVYWQRILNWSKSWCEKLFSTNDFIINLKWCQFTPQCYKLKINCFLHSVEPILILGSMAGNQGTKMFVPNLDDPNDLYACIIQQHQHPISLRRIPIEWRMIVWMLLVEERLAMQRTMYCSPDSEQFPKHWIWCRLHWVWWWF